MTISKASLKLLSTGIPGLDEVVGGGIPEYSFNLLAGTPGAGKTTLVHQFTFANASAERPTLYFTVVGEPAIKMLRYQQQMAFFDPNKVGTVIRFIDLSPEVLEGDLGAVLDKIVQHVKQANPGIVVVDSFRTVVRSRSNSVAGELEVQHFLQKLALRLTSWQTTSFLVGEYGEAEMQENPVFTVADAIIWLSQAKDRNAMVRKLEVVKMRGQATVPGLHTFRINSNGLQVFPRSMAMLSRGERRTDKKRVTTGVPQLDEMIGGGFLEGDATLIAGPSGAGKTVLGTTFIGEGVKRGEPGVLAVFEEHPDDYLARAQTMGFDLGSMEANGQLKVIYLRPVDLSADEILHQIQKAVAEVGAKRLVIDSLNGLELALAPTFRDEFRESLYRMVGGLTGGGVSVVLTIEVMESFEEIRFSPHAISFLSQNIIFLRYVEIESRLRRMLTVVKMRGSAHSQDLREYEITGDGMRVLQRLTGYQGVLTGVPTARAETQRSVTPGLTELETQVYTALSALPQATVEDLARGANISAADVATALRRLIALDYVLESMDGGETVYRPVSRPLGG
jgi:circadian clock protein KaiC